MRKKIYVYREKENTVINYVVGNKEVRKRIKRLKVVEKVELNHYPVIVTVEREGQKRKKRERKKEKSREEYGIRKRIRSFKG